VLAFSGISGIITTNLAKTTLVLQGYRARKTGTSLQKPASLLNRGEVFFVYRICKTALLSRFEMLLLSLLGESSNAGYNIPN